MSWSSKMKQRDEDKQANEALSLDANDKNFQNITANNSVLFNS